MLGVNVVCADTDERAEWLAGSGRLSFVRLRSGRPGRLPSPEEAAAHHYSAFEAEIARSWTSSHIVGSPERVRSKLLELADRTGADELMITTMVHGHADRLHSYELVAETMAIGND
jgi:alkanesulfonate monooxygenase SsuD/methylene tetrahydromethanopterin reductase-like flavin-dependent oxidoreductase (luciferase family)